MTELPACGYPLNDFCAQLSPAARCQLCALGQCVSFRRGKRLYMPSYANRPYLIHQGLIAQTVILPNGNSLCLEFYGRGNIAGSYLLFGNSVEFEKKTRFSYALKPVSGCLFYASDLEALFLKNTEFARLFQKQTGVESLRMSAHMLNMATYNSKEKLHYLCAVLEEHQISINDVTHKEIAMLLNMNRVTVTKTMKELLHGE